MTAVAKRLHTVEEYYFSKKLKAVRTLISEGAPVINLGIGSALGGWIASRWSYDKSDKTLKIILSFIILFMSIKLWFF